MPGTVLSTSHIVSHLIFAMSFHYSLLFSPISQKKRVDSQVKQLAQGHNVSKSCRQDLKLRNLLVELLLLIPKLQCLHGL